MDRRSDEECWPWLAGSDTLGYGKFGVRTGLVVRAHRYAWELTHGTIDDSQVLVCHRCDNRKCCNPGHMFLGSIQDNAADRVQKGRTAKGQQVSHLSEDDVRSIREEHSAGKSMRLIGLARGISATEVHRIVHRTRWGHVS